MKRELTYNDLHHVFDIWFARSKKLYKASQDRYKPREYRIRAFNLAIINFFRANKLRMKMHQYAAARAPKFEKGGIVYLLIFALLSHAGDSNINAFFKSLGVPAASGKPKVFVFLWKV